MAALLLLVCKLPSCRRGFLICSHCFRNNEYCSRACSTDGRNESARRARKKYAEHPDVRTQRRAREREVYAAKRRPPLPVDQTTSAPATMAKVRPARHTATIADFLARTKATHAHDSTNHRAPALCIRCAHCRCIGTRVLFTTRRFYR